MAREQLIRLFRRVWPRKVARWRRSALRRTGNCSDADDIVQEAVVRTLRANPDIDNTHETDSYVMKAIRDVAIDRHRLRVVNMKRRRAMIRAVNVNEAPSPLQRVIAVEEERSLQTRVIAAVTTELAKLTPELRQTIELYYLQEPRLNLREIAHIQGVSIPTAQRRRKKALEILAQGIHRGSK